MSLKGQQMPSAQTRTVILSCEPATETSSDGIIHADVAEDKANTTKATWLGGV